MADEDPPKTPVPALAGTQTLRDTAAKIAAALRTDERFQQFNKLNEQVNNLNDELIQQFRTPRMDAIVEFVETLRVDAGEGAQQPQGGGMEAAPDTAKAKRRIKPTPHENPESLLKGKTRVTKRVAGVILGLTERTIRCRIEDGTLTTVGRGHRQMVTVKSLRAQIRSSRKTA